MAFKRKFSGKKKGNFTRIGNMFKSKPDYLKEGMQFSYSTTTDGKYLEAVVEAINKIAEEGGAARFTLTKWHDQDNPVLSVSPAAPKGDSKRIGTGKKDTGFHGEEPGQDIL